MENDYPFENIIKPIISKLTLTGCHPKNPNLLATIWWSILFIMLLLWVTLSFQNIGLVNNIEQICDLIINISCLTQPIVGLFTIRKYRTNLLAILNTIQKQFWFNEKYNDDKMHQQHQLYYSILSKISLYYQTICYACIAIWMSEPLLRNTGKFPMDMNFPYTNFIKEYPYYYVTFFAQATSVLITATVAALLDIVYIACLGFALIQVDLIKQKLRALILVDNEQIMYDNLKNCIRHHIVILDILKNIEEMNKLLMLDKLLCDILCFCFVTYLFTLQKNLNLKFLLILAVSGSQPLLYCFFGDFVTSECESIGAEVYAVNWETYGYKSLINGLSMMILRSQKPVLMTAGGMIILSLPCYVAFVRLLFSFYIALEHLDNK